MEKFKYDLAVIGLGYVGLPLAVEATRSNLKVVGYDTAEDIVNSINNSISLIEDISQEELSDALGNGFIASNDDSVLGDAEFVIISVPTPLTDYQPDLQYVKAAAASIGRNLKDSQVIILESTTYPGTTEEVLVPEIKKQVENLTGRIELNWQNPARPMG